MEASPQATPEARETEQPAEAREPQHEPRARGGITYDQLVNWFTHHPPRDGQVDRYETLRRSALDFANVLVGLTPAGPDQTAAVRKIREAVMTGNAAIACGGK